MHIYILKEAVVAWRHGGLKGLGAEGGGRATGVAAEAAQERTRGGGSALLVALLVALY